MAIEVRKSMMAADSYAYTTDITTAETVWKVNSSPLLSSSFPYFNQVM